MRPNGIGFIEFRADNAGILLPGSDPDEQAVIAEKSRNSF